MNSIRYRIIGFLLATLSIIITTSSYYIYQHTQKEIGEVFNAQLAQVARTIDQLITETSIADVSDINIATLQGRNSIDGHQGYEHHYEKKMAYQVWDLEGNLVLFSENAPLHPLSATAPGFSRTEYENKIWYIFSLYSNSAKKWIYTAQNAEARDELIELITQDQLLSMLVVYTLVLLAVVFVVNYGIRPITDLGKEIAKRDGSNLSEIRMDVSKELYPIKVGINRLLSRMHAALTQERSFSADLSHELRTPLAAIKVNAQTIELNEKLSEEATLSLKRMIHGIDIMSKTIEQLLLLNSIESKKLTMMQEEFCLLHLSKDVLLMLPTEIHKKNDIELTGDNVFIHGNRALIAALIRNLVENASKYSSMGSSITVQISIESTMAVIDVVDNGPGMTDNQKMNAVTRHYRVSDSQTYGSGLGLSIVQKVAELHSGMVSFHDREGKQGLNVRVSIPIS